jgi:signal peptidase I
MAIVALLGVWLAFLRPGSLGGDTGYMLVSGNSMKPTLNDHDVVLVRKRDAYKVGDVIAYRTPRQVGIPARVIHRIVGGSAEDGYVTRGDNRGIDDAWHPTPRDIIGSRIVRLPRAGWIVAPFQSPVVLGVVAGSLAFLLFHSALASRARPRGRRGAPMSVVAHHNDGQVAHEFAARIRLHYERETSPEVRLGIRSVAFELAMGFAAGDPEFNKDRFLRECGIHAYDDELRARSAAAGELMA